MAEDERGAPSLSVDPGITMGEARTHYTDMVHDMTVHNLTTVVDTVMTTTNEEKLVAETCIHQDQLKRLRLYQCKEKYKDMFGGKTYTYIYFGCLGLDVIAARTCNHACWGNYSNGCPCVTLEKEKETYDDSRTQADSDLTRSVHQIENKDLFIFLPRKEKTREDASRTFDVFDFLSLCSVGWGPPLEEIKVAG